MLLGSTWKDPRQVQKSKRFIQAQHWNPNGMPADLSKSFKRRQYSMHILWFYCIMFERLPVQVVQFISKWACPDMFAYILLLLPVLNQTCRHAVYPVHWLACYRKSTQYSLIPESFAKGSWEKTVHAYATHINLACVHYAHMHYYITHAYTTDVCIERTHIHSMLHRFLFSLG